MEFACGIKALLETGPKSLRRRFGKINWSLYRGSLGFVLPLFWVICVQVLAQESPRTELQFLNGLDRVVEVYELELGGVRTQKTTLQAGRNAVIGTTRGTVFEVLGQDGERIGGITSEVKIQAYRVGGVPDFYTQRLEISGFPIVASSGVNPYALKEAAYIVNGMLGERLDVLEAMIKSGARLCILAHDEFTTDQPEWVWLARGSVEGFPGVTGKDFYDARARGMGGSRQDPFCSCGEENLLCFVGDPYPTESILIHELAHNIHLRGMVNIDDTFDRRGKETYDRAMREGLWGGKYASVNHHEYFAEGVQSWFDNNRQNDHDHNHVDTRLELIEYDPGLARLCREVFGEREFKYTKPQKRLEGHLEGYDPSVSPHFSWPTRLERVQQEIIRQAKSRPKN